MNTVILRDLSEISRREGGGGVETEVGSQLFETAENRGVMKNGPLKGGGSCKSCRGSPTEEERSSLFCKKKKNLGEIGELSDQLSESESQSDS